MRRRKIGIVIPCYGKPNILYKAVKQLERVCMHNKSELDILVVYMCSDEDKQLSEVKRSLHQGNHNSIILSANNVSNEGKIDIGTTYALTSNCEYIMSLESDDFIHEKLIELYLPYIKREIPVFGIKKVYCYDSISDTLIFYYFKKEYSDIIDAGKMTHRDSILDKDFIPFTVPADNFPYIVDYKSNENKNNFKDFFQKSTTRTGFTFEDPILLISKFRYLYD